MKLIFNKISKSEEDTKKIAKQIINNLNIPITIILEGDLGAGKTVFTKGFAQHLDITEELTSPTFTVMQQYSFWDNKILNHFDLYRLDVFEELFYIGIEDFLTNDSCINIIEWGEKFLDDFEDYLENFLYIKINILNNYDREILLYEK